MLLEQRVRRRDEAMHGGAAVLAQHAFKRKWKSIYQVEQHQLLRAWVIEPSRRHFQQACKIKSNDPWGIQCDRHRWPPAKHRYCKLKPENKRRSSGQKANPQGALRLREAGGMRRYTGPEWLRKDISPERSFWEDEFKSRLCFHRRYSSKRKTSREERFREIRCVCSAGWYFAEKHDTKRGVHLCSKDTDQRGADNDWNKGRPVDWIPWAVSLRRYSNRARDKKRAIEEGVHRVWAGNQSKLGAAWWANVWAWFHLGL